MAKAVVVEKKRDLKEMLMAIIGDEETCIGFLLAGIGDAGVGRHGENYMIVNSETPVSLIDGFMHRMVARPDIAMIFVASDVADRIRPTMNRYSRSLIPNVLEIPTKLQPYNPETDPVTQLAKVLMSSDDK